jgi:radical SAM-linked protein
VNRASNQHPSATVAAGTDGAAPARSVVGAAYAILGDLRFLSHQEERRGLERAMVRAAWPLRYSRGFNPRPRITLPLPRPVGLASMCQVALVDLERQASADDLEHSLSEALPAGLQLECVFPHDAGRPLRPLSASYEAALEDVNGAAVRERVSQALAADSLIGSRTHRERSTIQSVDFRPYIQSMEFDGRTLRMTLGFIQQRSARPGEILRALGLVADGQDVIVTRTAVAWDEHCETGRSKRPPLSERNDVVNTIEQAALARRAPAEINAAG